MGSSKNCYASHPACKGCIYLGAAGNYPVCNYLLATKQRRPCPAGAGCTVKVSKSKGVRKTVKRVTWDERRARALLAEGKSDIETADMVGIAVSTLRSWKQRNGLTRKRAPATAEEATTQPVITPAETTPRESAPAEKCQMRVSFSVAGCEGSLSAADIPTAFWGVQYLLQMLNGMKEALSNQERERETLPGQLTLEGWNQ